MQTSENTSTLPVLYVTEINREQLAAEINRSLNNINDDAAWIQSQMLELLAPMQDMFKKDIIHDPALNAVFCISIQGTVRAKLAEWVETFTPIKLKYDRDSRGVRTGKVLGLTIPKKNPKPWNLEQAAQTPFIDYTRTSIKGLAKPKLSAALDNVVKVVARMYDTSDDLSIDQIKEIVQAKLVDGLAANVLEHKMKESHVEWVIRYHTEREEAKRHAN